MTQLAASTRPSPTEAEAHFYCRMFRHFGEKQVGDSPLYQQICVGVAEHPDVASILHDAPPTQRIPNILLAAVHYLLLRGADHELRDWYPSASVSAASSTPTGANSTDPASAFVDFCRTFRSQVGDVVGARATQTNEVGRSAGLLAALAWIGESPVGLLELGASGGLNLFADRYGCDYGSGYLGDRGSAVQLSCELRGARPPALDGRGTVPTVAWRRGLDQSPIRVTDDAEAQWLLACLWPDQPERFARLQAAIGIARTDPPVLLQGSIPDDVPALLAEVPANLHLVVVTTWVLSYVPPAGREVLRAHLDTLARTRDLTWIAAEEPSVLGLRVDGIDPLSTALAALTYRGGVRRETLLGTMHPHGRWLDWRADADPMPGALASAE